MSHWGEKGVTQFDGVGHIATIGEAILNKTRKGAHFDDDIQLVAMESTEDDIDVTHVKEEKLRILRPIRRPNLYNAMLSHVRPHCIAMMRQAIGAF